MFFKVKSQIFTFLLLFTFSCVFAQQEDAWVYFKDKPSKTTFIANPLTMLSQRALDRRTRFQIPLDLKDVPIESNYQNQIKNTIGISVLAKSKWLNALHVQGAAAAIETLKNLSFVSHVVFANKFLNKPFKASISQNNNKLNFTSDFNYGQAENQIKQLHGEALHQKNFTGEGMQIAVIDAGFPNVDTFDAFQRLRDNKQILGGYNFVERSTNFYTGHYHGMAVLSTIAGYIENEFVGTAPNAQFYLFISEDVSQETPLEESLWAEAAEKADSLGVDIINTSLGYNTFDNPNYNHTYAEMDGKTTFIARAAEIAFERGIILVNAVGNEGNDSWHYMLSPADAPSVLSVGAVNAVGEIANFSSFGPTADNRVKPDVCAQGASVYIINSTGNIATSNGTSFASPIMAGMAACLWQAFPNKTNREIVTAIKTSAHLYKNPTAQEGYGIPNFEKVFVALTDETVENEVLSVFPNPVKNKVNFKFPRDISTLNISFYNLLGKLVETRTVVKEFPNMNISHFSNGMYIMRIKYSDKVKTIKIIKN